VSERTIKIRGFAAPFEQFGLVDGEWEEFAPFAFDVAGSQAIDFRIEHFGEPLTDMKAGGLWVAQNQHGLIYEAEVRLSETIFNLIPSMKRRSLGASVNMIGVREGVDRIALRDEKGRAYHRICRAQIDHIALCHNACYGQTSAWPASWEDDFLPPGLQSDVERWHAPIKASAASLRRSNSPLQFVAHGGRRPSPGRRLTSAEVDRSIAKHAARISLNNTNLPRPSGRQ
jgi:hypothetical protein